LTEFATVVVSVARVIIPTRIEIHGRTTFPMRTGGEMAGDCRSGSVGLNEPSGEGLQSAVG
jgi:hypothetical protein